MDSALLGIPGENQIQVPGLVYPDWDPQAAFGGSLVGYFKTYQQGTDGLVPHPSLTFSSSTTYVNGRLASGQVTAWANIVGPEVFVPGTAASEFGFFGRQVPMLNFFGSYYTSNLVPATGANPRSLMVVGGNYWNVGGNAFCDLVHYGTGNTNQAYGISSRTSSVDSFGNNYWGGNVNRAWPNHLSLGRFVVATNVYNGTIDRLYMNGIQTAADYTIALNTGSTGMRLFENVTVNGEKPGGQVVIVAAWNIALTDNQVAESAWTVLNFLRQYGINS